MEHKKFLTLWMFGLAGLGTTYVSGLKAVSIILLPTSIWSLLATASVFASFFLIPASFAMHTLNTFYFKN